MLLIQLLCQICASAYLSSLDFISYNCKKNRKDFSELIKCWENLVCLHPCSGHMKQAYQREGPFRQSVVPGLRCAHG